MNKANRNRYGRSLKAPQGKKTMRASIYARTATAVPGQPDESFECASHEGAYAGVEQRGASVVTTHALGAFRTDAAALAEFRAALARR